MAIEHEDGKYHCKFDYHEPGYTLHRRIHELVILAHDGRTYRFRGESLPTSIIGKSGKLEDGRHVLELFCGPQFPKSFFGLILRLKIRDVFFMWFGAFCITGFLTAVISILLARH